MSCFEMLCCTETRQEKYQGYSFWREHLNDDNSLCYLDIMCVFMCDDNLDCLRFWKTCFKKNKDKQGLFLFYTLPGNATSGTSPLNITT